MRLIIDTQIKTPAEAAGTTRVRRRLASVCLVAFLCCTAAVSAQHTTASSDPDPFKPTDSVPKTVNIGLGIAPYSSGVQLPDPESGSLQQNAYVNKYFALAYTLPHSWTESVKGPPPSATGYYVLTQLRTSPASDSRGTMLISASDMFFLLRPAANAMDLLQQSQHGLPDVITVERPPAEVRIGNRSFVRMDYTGAEIHWSVLATEIRCHTVQFVFTSRDTELIERLVQGLGTLTLPASNAFPVCIKDYANGANLVHKVDPFLVGPKYTSVPVRVIVGKDGKVKHIHVITAFPEQARSISDALTQWIFKPYLQNGLPAEVETGLLFEFKPDGVKSGYTPEEKVSQQ